jgi:DNA-binding response OmpR family regulator
LSTQPKVLVVEDDTAIRTLLAVAFRREPLLVDLAEDGMAALDLLSKNDYAVIIVDMMMPRMDGEAFLTSLPGHLRKRPIVFAMTAYDDSLIRRIPANVVHGWIRKPFDLQRLVSIVRDCAEIMTGIARGRTLPDVRAAEIPPLSC